MTPFCYFCIIMTSQLHNYHLKKKIFSIFINCYQGLPLCKILASKHNHIKSYDRKTNFTPPWKYDIFWSLLKIALPLFRPISGILPIYRTSDYLLLFIQTWTLPFLMRKLGYIKMFTKALSDPGLRKQILSVTHEIVPDTDRWPVVISCTGLIKKGPRNYGFWTCFRTEV